MVKAVLLKPLDGRVIGTILELSQADFHHLMQRNAVKAAAQAEDKAAPEPENKAAPAARNKRRSKK